MIYSRIYFPHYITHTHTHTPDDDKLIVFQVNSKLWSSLFGHIKGPTGIQLYRENHSYYIHYNVPIYYACRCRRMRWRRRRRRYSEQMERLDIRGSVLYIPTQSFRTKTSDGASAPLVVYVRVLIYIVFTSVAERIFYLIIRRARHCSSGDDERTGEQLVTAG